MATVVKEALSDLVLQMREEGDTSGVAELRKAVRTKNYDNSHSYLKTVYFPDKVSKGGRYPDYAPEATSVFSSHMTFTYNITTPETGIVVDPAICDPAADVVKIGSQRYTANKADGAESADAIYPFANPYTLFKAIRLIGAAVHIEFIGGTSFGSCWLGCKRASPTAGSTKPRTSSHKLGSGFVASGYEYTPNGGGSTMTDLITYVAGLGIDSSLESFVAQRKYEIQASGFYSEGDFATGCRMFVPAADTNLLRTSAEFATEKRPFIVGQVLSSATSAAGVASGADFSRMPSMRLKLFRWFEAAPYLFMSPYLPVDRAEPSYTTREFTENPLKTTPGIFSITPRDLDEKYRIYKGQLGYHRVINNG